jgi:small subunit ribosomal protein S3
MIEKDFVTEGLKRTRIDEFLESELERAGYGGMEIQVTPLGTMVVVYAERPGMVIGRGGKTVRAITKSLKDNYELENPQVEVKEVDIPELNPKIMAHKIAAMLQRGMHFRRVAYSTLRRIMGSGAQGVEVTISGKIRGSRSATAKFSDGYIKKCGEPATKYVKEGFATVQLKPGVLGIFVRIMPPGVVLPDKVDIIKPTVEEAPAPAATEIEEEVTEESAEILEEIIEEAPEEAEEVPEAEVAEEAAPEEAEETTETESLEEKVEVVKEAVEEKTAELTDAVEDKVEEVKEKATKAKSKATKTKKAAEKKSEEVVEAAEEKAEEVKTKAAEAKEAVEEKATEAKEEVAEVKKKAAEVKEAAEEKTEKVKSKAAELSKKSDKS